MTSANPRQLSAQATTALRKIARKPYRVLRVASIGMAALLAVGCAIPTTTPLTSRHHYNPVDLNEQAIRAFIEGDRSTAVILLERAALLAPYDQQIASNLALLKEQRQIPLGTVQQIQQAESIDSAAPAKAAQSDDPAGDSLPPLPATGIWPSK